MVWHIFGWLTMTAIAVTGLGTTRWLWDVGRYPMSWHRPPKAPKPIEDGLFVIHGDDYIGLI